MNGLAQMNSDLTAFTGAQDDHHAIRLHNYASNPVATYMDSNATVNQEFSNHIKVSGQNIPVNLSYKSSTNSLIPQKKAMPKIPQRDPSFEKPLMNKSS